MNRVILRQNAFGRWIIVNAVDQTTAWSGSRFVPITHDGFPASDVQISNLDTQDSATEYVVSFGFEVVAPTERECEIDRYLRRANIEAPPMPRMSFEGWLIAI